MTEVRSSRPPHKIRCRALSAWPVLAVLAVAQFREAPAQEIGTPLMVPPVAVPDTTSTLLPSALDLGLTAGSDGAVAAASGCPVANPWWIQQDVPRDVLLEAAESFDQAGFRPISVSATGSGDGARFDVIWIQDELAEQDLWALRIDMTPEQFEQNQEEVLVGHRPIAIDAYGEGDELRYVAAWVDDNGNGEYVLGTDAATIQAGGLVEDTFSPVWIDGHFDGERTIYSVLWSDDGFERELELDLVESINDEDIWKNRTDLGWRMLRLSRYRWALPDEEQDDPDEVATELRFAGVWQKDVVGCGVVHWEAFRGHTHANLHVKALAQAPEPQGPFPFVNVGTLQLEDQVFPGRVVVEGAQILGDEALLRRIESTGSQPKHGDILILQPRPGRRFFVSDDALGNIRLRRWEADAGLDPDEVAEGCAQLGVTCRGQSMRLDDYQTRLALQFDASDDTWREVQRNGLSPDRYAPFAIDATSEAGGRRFASVWAGREHKRRFLVSSGVSPSMLNAASSADQQAHQLMITLDEAIREFMQERLIPSALLAVAVDGRLVASRGYSYEPLEWQEVFPFIDSGNTLFRIASVSKPITAVAIMKLVEQGALDLDQPLSQIPGLFDLIGSGWDGGVTQMTLRQLMGHLGGWDRDVSPDFTVGQDFQICSTVEPSGLPTVLDRILDYARGFDLDHIPGRTYAYSNFGYTLLGRIVEAASGQPYEQFVRENVLLPAGATTTLLHPPGPGGELTNEIQYFSPGYPMPASAFGIGINDDHPLREECNRNHADLVPIPYGTSNIRLMDSHGGWLSSPPDLARLMIALDDPNILDPEMRGEMWTRQRRREMRVFTFDIGTGDIVERSFDARMSATQAPTAPNIALPNEAGDRLVIGKGLKPFGQLTFTFDSLGEGYEVRFEYFGNNGWADLSTEDHNLSDGSEGFSVMDANNQEIITFEPPDDWRPEGLPGFDITPRYWIRMTALSDPDVVAEATQIVSDPELNYALGWNTSSAAVDRFRIPVTSFDNTIFVGTPPAQRLIVGAQSQASATARSTSSAGGGLTLSVSNVSGGSFQPGEDLRLQSLQGPVVGQVGERRERAFDVTASHDGALAGSRSRMVRRSDGIYWVVMLNQDLSEAAFYLPDHDPGGIGLDAIISNLETLFSNTPGLDWPSWDLFD